MQNGSYEGLGLLLRNLQLPTRSYPEALANALDAVANRSQIDRAGSIDLPDDVMPRSFPNQGPDGSTMAAMDPFHQCRAECRTECLPQLGRSGRMGQGMSYFRCLNSCYERNGCM